MTHTRSDEKLMLAYQSGEANAFAERYTRHKVPPQLVLEDLLAEIKALCASDADEQARRQFSVMAL